MYDINLLAKQMRDRALASSEPETIYKKIYEPTEEQKKLYFNAGRWAGGSRDFTAREAMIKLKEAGEM